MKNISEVLKHLLEASFTVKLQSGRLHRIVKFWGHEEGSGK